jgi:hypothetical protein
LSLLALLSLLPLGRLMLPLWLALRLSLRLSRLRARVLRVLAAFWRILGEDHGPARNLRGPLRGQEGLQQRDRGHGRDGQQGISSGRSDMRDFEQVPLLGSECHS